MAERYERVLNRARKNLTNTNNEIKKDYRIKDVDEDNFHMFKRALEEINTSYAEFSKAREEYEDILEDASVESVSNEDEVMLTSSKKTLRILNAKIDKYVEERQRADEKEQRERQLSDEKEMRVRRLAEELALKDRERADELVIKQSEIESKERIELEKLRLTAATTSSSASSATTTASEETRQLATTNLPKITLPTFSGDVSHFQEFWDCFNAAVDSRSDLNNSVKLTYLKSVLSGQAASLVFGLRITDDNYQIAKNILLERYDIPQLVTSKLFKELMNLKPLSTRTSDVHKFYTEVEMRLKLLESHNCNIEHAILRDHLFELVSYSTQNKLVEEKGVHITVQSIRESINKELRLSQIREAFQYHPGESVSVSKVNQGHRQTTNPYFRGVGNKSYLPTTSALVSSNVSAAITYPCVFCNSDKHANYECNKYRSVDERRQRMLDRCFLCLSQSHFFGNCPVRNRTSCYYCKQIGHHNSAICPKQFGGGKHVNNNTRQTVSNQLKPMSSTKHVQDKSLVTIRNNDAFPKEESCSVSNSGEMTLCAKNGIQTRVYLQTATIKLINPKTNVTQKVRAVLDSGATSSYISQQLFDSLGLKREYTKQVNVYTFGQSSSRSMVVQGAKIMMEDKVGKSYNLEVSVVPTIVGNTKRELCEVEWIRELKKQYELADEYYEAGNDETFHLLLGNDYYSSIMLDDKKIQILENMYLVNTVFGYVLSGKMQFVCESNSVQVNHTNLFIRMDDPLHYLQDIRTFWDLDVIGIRDNPHISDDDMALQHFDEHIKYVNKRYHVSLPWKDNEDKHNIQTNFGLALGRLTSVLRRHRNDGILEVCKDTFENQLQSGILEKVDDVYKTQDCHYLPFHAVCRSESETTKVRFVMDASAKQNKSKPSLNELLYRGPVLLENLCSILLRFRLYKYGLIGDIEKAFLNVGLNAEDRDYTRILWVKDTSSPASKDNLVAYRHTRIPFGVSSSPFLLAGVLDSHLSKYGGKNFKLTSNLKQDIYVDNLITGLNESCKIVEFIGKSREIFQEASFNLRCWSTNYKGNDFENLPKDLKSESKIQNVLGLGWNVDTDCLNVKQNYERDKKIRHVDVKLPNGIVVSRPVSWLYPFECDDNHSD
uniref:Peptidase aspartic putative domain-containing protein n=1 Tax=Cacopsylla melanoneura TaxID=428564 RepID=A0A8D8UC74_9HEMI